MKMKTTLLLLIFSLGAYSIQAQCNGATFEEKNGIVVMEAETVSLKSSWKKKTNVGGFTGSSYITWDGQQYLSSPGNGTIEYTIKINNPGVYRFRWRSTYGIGDAGSEHNDTWVKFPDAFDFFGQKNTKIKYPKGGTFKKSNDVVNGASGNGWMKIYRSGNNKAFTWSTSTSDFEGLRVYVEFKSAGVYKMQFSARSKAHHIDRIVLYKESMWSNSQATNTGLSESKCGGGGNNPPPPPPDDDDPPPPPPSGGNNPPTVNITSPNDGQNFNVGSTVTVNLNSNDSDGNVSKHEIFVNGTRVDTDGSNYSAHKITNIAAGNYTIRAKVTDNDGATAENTVDITVGGGGGNPPPPDDDDPPPPPSGGNNPPTVSITSPNNGQNFSAGSTVTVNLNANDSDGTVVKHEIFVDNSKVDTDGSSYTAHKIRNISNGSYAIRAKVTDNDGATAETTVNITVGGGGGNPPPPPPPTGNVTFTLINSSTDNDISTLSSGSNIANGSNKNVRANVNLNGVKSVRMVLQGPSNTTRTENVAPYALFGDSSGNYANGNLSDGSYSLTATAFSGKNASGTNLGSSSINFTVGGAGKSSDSVYAYPNPVKGNSVTVKLPEATRGDVFYRLIDPSGVEVESGMLSRQGSSDAAEIKMKTIDSRNNGVYYLMIQANFTSYTIPIIKE